MTERAQGGIRRAAAAGALALLVGPLGSRAAEAGAIRDGNFSFPAGRPAAPAYGPDPATRCTGIGSARLPRDVERLAAVSKVAPPRPDGILCAMAGIFLGWSDASPPRDGVLEFASGAMGLATPVRQVLLAEMATDDDDVVSERLAETIVSFGRTRSNARYGVATSIIPKENRLAREGRRVVLVLGEEPLVLDPLPRRLALGGQAPLSGKLQGSLENPGVVVSDTKGQITTPPQEPGKAFKADLRCGDRPGTIRVEVSAELTGARRVVANFPVACGTELPTKVPVAAPPWPPDAAAQEMKVLEFINAERTQAGIPALAWDPAVAGVARSLAEGLSDENRRAAAAATVGEELLKAGVPSPVLLVNPAQGRTVEEVQERLLRSPVHRANSMSAEVNQAGVGIATVHEKSEANRAGTGRGAATDTSGVAKLFLVELFVKVPPPVDPVAARQELLAAIAARRAEAKAPLLPVEPALQEVAQKYAEEMAAAKGKLPEARDTQLLDSLRKAYKGVNMLAGAATSTEQFAKDRKVLANGKALGVGLAQGQHPTAGRNALYVVILIGEPQDPQKSKGPKPKAATK